MTMDSMFTRHPILGRINGVNEKTESNFYEERTAIVIYELLLIMLSGNISSRVERV